MARPKTNEYWHEVIFSCLVREPKMPARAIVRELWKHWRELEEADPRKAQEVEPPPGGERTIRRIITLEWKTKTDEERQKFHQFSWPQDMERAGLPWDASRPILDLLRHLRPFGRPLIRSVKWYWRIYLATPGLDIGERFHIAGKYASWEVLGAESADEKEALECYLAFAPWPPGSKAAQEYVSAVEKGHIPAKTMMRVEFGEEDSITRKIEVTQAMLGFTSPIIAKALEEIFGGTSEDAKEVRS